MPPSTRRHIARRVHPIAAICGAIAIAGCALVKGGPPTDDEGSWSELWIARTHARTPEEPAPGKATLVVCVEALGGGPGSAAGATVQVGDAGIAAGEECGTLTAAVGKQPTVVRRVGFEPAERTVLVRSNYVDTLRARLAHDGIPSRAACRAAARAGHGCL